jgi:hypothetical protein
MAKQRKLSTEIGDFNGVGGMTEHEAFFLPEVKGGTKVLDLGYEDIYGYELLGPIIENARTEFKKTVVKGIGEADFNKINKGLRSYVRSTSLPSETRDLLKASILNAFGEDLLTNLYDLSDAAIKQMIKPAYFEKVEAYLCTDKSKLIAAPSILYYQRKAVEITKKYYEIFLKTLDEPEDMYESILYLGFGNYRYYEEERKGEADLLSVYGGLGESTYFFADQLLNSYSINNRVAEHFMVMGNNERRAMFNAEFSAVIDDLFSSFFVSKWFKAGQYEFLALPNRREIHLYERFSSDLITDFILTEKPKTFLEDNMPSKDDILNITDEVDYEEDGF